MVIIEIIQQERKMQIQNNRCILLQKTLKPSHLNFRMANRVFSPFKLFVYNTVLMSLSLQDNLLKKKNEIKPLIIRKKRKGATSHSTDRCLTQGGEEQQHSALYGALGACAQDNFIESHLEVLHTCR